MGFLVESLLWGTAAVAVPIIIHLLNRRKFKKVIWAAMKFVQLSIDQNQRRLRVEDLILLLLRCALLILLALALARPVLPESESSVLGQASVTSVLVIDNSLSMQLEEGGSTQFDKAKEASRDILEAMPKGSSVAVFLASDVVQPMIPKPSLDLDAVKDEIANAPVSDSGTALFPAIDRAITTLKGRAALRKEIYVVTDVSAAGWNKSRAIQSLLEENKDDITVHFVIVGGEGTGGRTPANLSVVSLQPADNVVTVGRKIRFNVRVANHSDQNQTNVDVRLTQGLEGENEVGKVVDIVPAGGEEIVSLTTILNKPGLHTLSARVIPGEGQGQAAPDMLAADNNRKIVVNAIREARVLLVNGGANPDEPYFDDASMLMEALEPRKPGQAFHVSTKIVSTNRLDLVDLEGFEAVALANVAALPQSFLQTLTNFVASGKGLMVFPGDNLDSTISTDFYNKTLHSELGLLPAAYGQTVGTSGIDRNVRNYVTLKVDSLSHSVLEEWRKLDGQNKESLRKSVNFYCHKQLLLPREISVSELEEGSDGAWRVKGETELFDGWGIHSEAEGDLPQQVRYVEGKPVLVEGDQLRAGQPQVVLRFSEGQHVIATGDTLENVAKLYAIEEDLLRKANPKVKDWDNLVLDQVLRFPSNGPSVVEATWGEGRVYQFSSTSDAEWNNLFLNLNVIMFMHPVLGSLLQNQISDLNVKVGQPLNRSIGKFSEPGLEAYVIPPGADEEQAKKGAIERVNGLPTFRYGDTDRAGVYQVSFKYPPGELAKTEPPKNLQFAVRTDRRESDLRPIANETRKGVDDHAVVHDWPAKDLSGEIRKNRIGAELWLPFVIVALLLAAVEIWAAQRFSRPK